MSSTLDRPVPWQSIDRGTWARQAVNPNVTLDALDYQTMLAERSAPQLGQNRLSAIPSMASQNTFSTLGSLYTGASSQGLSSLASSFGLNARLADRERAEKAAAAAAAAAAASGGGFQDTTGMGSPNGAEWARVNQYDGYVKQASAVTGVPANAIKAVMRIESQGVLDAVSPMTSSGHYFGLMQIGATSSVPEYMKQQSWLRGNAYNQILAGATELANKYKAIGAQNWTQAAGAYFGYGSDVTGQTTSGYMGTFNRYMQELNSATQGGAIAGGGGGNWGGGSGLSGAFPKAGNISPNFGVSSGNGLYGYGTSYGLNGTQHTGLDIMQPLKSPIYAPAGGQVICVGCWRNDHMTGGIGRIELLMPDGAHVLFDHTFSSVVNVGDRIQPGQLLGHSGGMYSPHTHLEVRYPDRSTSSGYRLIDPLQYFGGGVAGNPTGGGGYAPTRSSQPGFGATISRPLSYNPFWK